VVQLESNLRVDVVIKSPHGLIDLHAAASRISRTFCSHWLFLDLGPALCVHAFVVGTALPYEATLHPV